MRFINKEWKQWCEVLEHFSGRVYLIFIFSISDIYTTFETENSHLIFSWRGSWSETLFVNVLPWFCSNFKKIIECLLFGRANFFHVAFNADSNLAHSLLNLQGQYITRQLKKHKDNQVNFEYFHKRFKIYSRCYYKS